MASGRLRILSLAAASFTILALTIGGAPIAMADNVCHIHCQDMNTHPTPGVTCDEQIWTTGDDGRGYRGKCTGSPTGFSRGYKYREEIKCDFDGASAWLYGPYEVDGSWSTLPHMCPNGAVALAHDLKFVWV
jgi:hypothetical protein